MKASRDKQLYNDSTLVIESWREHGNVIFTRTFSLGPPQSILPYSRGKESQL